MTTQYFSDDALPPERRHQADPACAPAVSPTFEDLSVDYDSYEDSDRPFLDRRHLSPAELSQLDDHQRLWRDNGYLILEKFIPENILEAYTKVRAAFPHLGGWGPVPYLYHDEIKDFCLYQPLVSVLEKLLGDRVILHLNLTGWVSTQRDFHQDDYLNPPCVKGSYLAIWAALDDIHPDSGPFEYVPGSHRWRVLSREKVLSHLPPHQAQQAGGPGDEGHWADYSQQIVASACEDYIRRRGGKIVPFLGKRGDVLIWHGCLLHRGSLPKVPGMLRKTLIAHYSGVRNREDFPRHDTLVYPKTGGLYQHFDMPLHY